MGHIGEDAYPGRARNSSKEGKGGQQGRNLHQKGNEAPYRVGKGEKAMLIDRKRLSFSTSNDARLDQNWFAAGFISAGLTRRLRKASTAQGRFCPYNQSSRPRFSSSFHLLIIQRRRATQRHSHSHPIAPTEIHQSITALHPFIQPSCRPYSASCSSRSAPASSLQASTTTPAPPAAAAAASQPPPPPPAPVPARTSSRSKSRRQIQS